MKGGEGSGGVLSTEQDTKILERYNEYMNSDEQRRLRSYRNDVMHVWTEEEVRRFKEAFKMYSYGPTSNRKIAEYIGGDVHPNHVAYFKHQYNKKLKEKKKRIEREEAERRALEEATKGVEKVPGGEDVGEQNRNKENNNDSNDSSNGISDQSNTSVEKEIRKDKKRKTRDDEEESVNDDSMDKKAVKTKKMKLEDTVTSTDDSNSSLNSISDQSTELNKSNNEEVDNHSEQDNTILKRSHGGLSGRRKIRIKRSISESSDNNNIDTNYTNTMHHSFDDLLCIGNQSRLPAKKRKK